MNFIKKYNFIILFTHWRSFKTDMGALIMDTYPYTDFMWYHVKAVEISQGKGFLNGIYPYYTGNPGDLAYCLQTHWLSREL